MCLIVFAYETHPAYRLILGANRDEFHDRPAAPARFWPETPDLLAGRDRRDGGTWLGVSRGGRFAAVTNLRSPRPRREGAPSRGWLVRDFLAGPAGPRAFVDEVWEGAGRFNGFALLAGDASELWFCSNGGAPPRRLSPGLYGLSNHLLDTPWPKVERAKEGLAAVLSPRGGAAQGRSEAAPDHGEVSPEDVLRLLADRTRADDARLPDTGVGLEQERVLSPIHVAAPGYGTRCSTALLIDRKGGLTFVERSFTPAGAPEGEVSHRFTIHRGSP